MRRTALQLNAMKAIPAPSSESSALMTTKNGTWPLLDPARMAVENTSTSRNARMATATVTRIALVCVDIAGCARLTNHAPALTSRNHSREDEKISVSTSRSAADRVSSRAARSPSAWAFLLFPPWLVVLSGRVEAQLGNL